MPALSTAANGSIIGDINPADLAQAGSERARNRIIADGGRRTRYDDPTYGWNHGMQALPWWMGWNQRIIAGVTSVRRGHSITQGVDRALEIAQARGDIDAGLAARIRDGFDASGQPVTEVAVGFIPLVPVLLKAGAAAVADHTVRKSLAREPGAAPAPAVTITVEEPTPAAEPEAAGACRACGGSGVGALVGVASTPTSRLETFRGDFTDLIDTDGFRVRL